MIRFLRHDDQWPRFRRFGFEVEAKTAALRLRSMPGPPVAVGYLPGLASEGSSQAGIAVGDDGTVFLADITTHRIYRLAPGSMCASTFVSLGDEAAPATGDWWKCSMSLTYDTCRNRLLIADARNHRILVIDSESGQTVGVFALASLGEFPGPIACDAGGNAHAIIYDTAQMGRVVKFTPDGLLDAAYACAVAETLETSSPVLVACGSMPDGNRQPLVYVLAQSAARAEAPNVDLQLFVFDTNGKSKAPARIILFRGNAETALRLPMSLIDSPLATTNAANTSSPSSHLRGAAVIGTMLVIGIARTDASYAWVAAGQDRVWCFEIGDVLKDQDASAVDGSWLATYQGPVAGLAVRRGACGADLLVHGGPAQSIMAMPGQGAYRLQGAFLAGPFPGHHGRLTPWHRLRLIGKFPEGGRCQIFTLSRNEGRFGFDDPVRLNPNRFPNWYRVEGFADLFEKLGFAQVAESEPIDAIEEILPDRSPRETTPLATPDLSAPNTWYAAPEGQIDFLLRNSPGTPKEPADQLWIFGLFAGDGNITPSFVQARLEFDEAGWLDDLPACYQQHPRDRTFLRSLLAFFESAFETVTEGIDRLPALFSPDMVTQIYGRGSPELAWLADTLALPLPGLVDDARRIHQMFLDGPYWLARVGDLEGF